MSFNVNEVFLMGNLTQDAESGMINNDSVFKAKFSIAYNTYKQNGETYDEEVNYVELAIFGKSAQKLAKYLVKGKKVLIKGELKQDRWETENGEKRSKLSVRVKKLILLSNGKKEIGGTYNED